MNMIKYHIKQWVRALGYIVLVNVLLCNTSAAVKNNMIITHVEPSRYTQTGRYDEKLEQVCKHWMLSNDEIMKVFNISNEYNNHSIILDDYYWLPCEIKGVLIYKNKEWNFSINGATSAQWDDGHSSIYFGCSIKECNSLFLLPYDGMSTE